MSPRAEPPLFRVEFSESNAVYKPAAVNLELVARRTAPPRRVLNMDEYQSLLSGPEIDILVPFEYSIASEAMPGRELRNYLRFTEPVRTGQLAVQFWVDPSESLTNLEPARFDEVVRKTFDVTVKVKLKGTFGSVSGKFRVKVESRVKIHWEWTGHPLGFPEMSETDRPVLLQPDGLSWFRLKVWTTTWDLRNGREVRTDPDAYEYTHWIAPGHRDVDFKVMAPDPVPDDPRLRGSKQDENDWYSKVDLPDLQRISSIDHLPFDAEMRVRAWHRGAIARRLEDKVIPKDGEFEIGEVVIPVRLVKWYIITFEVYLDGEPDYPLRTYQVRVNGERVPVYCPNLPCDVAATLRWKLSGPAQYLAPSRGAFGAPLPMPPLSPGSRRRYHTEFQLTPLVPVVAPSGKSCLGIVAPLEIAENTCSDAIPPVHLDVELPNLFVNWVACSTGSSIVVEHGRSVDVTFLVTYKGTRAPARNTPLTWRVIPTQGKSQGSLRPMSGTTDDRGRLQTLYDHDVSPLLRRRREIHEAISQAREILRALEESARITQRRLAATSAMQTLRANPRDPDPEAHWRLYREAYMGPVPDFVVPGSGQLSTSRWWQDFQGSKDMAELKFNLRAAGRGVGGRMADPRRQGLMEQARKAIEQFNYDLEVRIPRMIAHTQSEIERLQRSIPQELWSLTPPAERVDFLRNGQLVNPVTLAIHVRVDRIDGAVR